MTAAALTSLRARGFDSCTRNRADKAIRVHCSQCAAAIINGVACHERGCPNAVHECAGCNELIPMNRKFCEGCIS